MPESTPELVTTSCRGCGQTLLVPLELFDRYVSVSHYTLGEECDRSWWKHLTSRTT